MAAADELAPRFSSPFLTEDSPEPDVPTFSFRRISNAISTISRKRRLSSFEASKSLKWRRRGTIAKGKQPVWTDPEAAEKLWREGYCRETEAGEDAGNGDEVDETDADFPEVEIEYLAHEEG
ncbi:hypothetical protein LTR04_001438 [Oleoguttula sp. CCFEE 6159]|nr:hypothetical protein LTR04_001438 [Oleoguttula sp. CCFEE 6159]